MPFSLVDALGRQTSACESSYFDIYILVLLTHPALIEYHNLDCSFSNVYFIAVQMSVYSIR